MTNDYELFSTYLRLDPETGKLYWKKRTGPRDFSGMEAGSLNQTGYIHIRFNRQVYKAHRIVWLLVYGQWPLHNIDHINRIKNDNRPSNLRDVNHSLNAENAKVRIDNTSGFQGVHLSNSGQWVARRSGKYIGTYPTKEEAAEARKTFIASLSKEVEDA